MKYYLIMLMALVITLSAGYYQRVTGPSHPKKVKTELAGRELKFSLPRSNESTSSCEVRIPAAQQDITGRVFFRRFPTGDTWDTLTMVRSNTDLIALLPAQPPAGKLEYFVELADGSETRRLDGENTAVIRFRGPVPAVVLILHVFMMFLAMLCANIAGLSAAFRHDRMRIYTIYTLVLMVLGGFILGPVMQKYAFGEFWTGVPFGWDLTDNKTLIAVVFWVLAFVMNRTPGKNRPFWIILAAVITLVVFSIPHSLFGSELNYATGAVTTG